MMKFTVPFFLILLLPLTARTGEPAMTGKAHRDCRSTCHKPHGAKGDGVMLKRESLDDLCLSCHNSPDPLKMAGEATQIDRPLNFASTHIKLREEGSRARYTKRFEVNGRQRQLQDTCSGCHNPHLTRGEKLKTFSFNERGEFQSSRNRFVGELCLGCHSGTDAARTLRASDLGPLFAATARSNHSLGSSSETRKDLPSLRSPLNNRPLDCISCHNDPAGKGPHYSVHASLLVAPYKKEMEDPSSGLDSGNICFLCHSRDSIEANESFPYHKDHLSGIFNIFPDSPRATTRKSAESFAPLPSKGPSISRNRFAPGFGRPSTCSTCHDPHGSLDNPRLINFDRGVVSPSSTGRIEYRRLGNNSGYCTLSCHGYDHVESEY